MLATKIETDFLEQLFEDDCKCESEHPLIQCSFKVTHHVRTTCGTEGKVCENSARSARYLSSVSYATCGYCYEPHSICPWTIRPI